MTKEEACDGWWFKECGAERVTVIRWRGREIDSKSDSCPGRQQVQPGWHEGRSRDCDGSRAAVLFTAVLFTAVLFTAVLFTAVLFTAVLFTAVLFTGTWDIGRRWTFDILLRAAIDLPSPTGPFTGVFLKPPALSAVANCLTEGPRTSGRMPSHAACSGCTHRAVAVAPVRHALDSPLRTSVKVSRLHGFFRFAFRLVSRPVQISAQLSVRSAHNRRKQQGAHARQRRARENLTIRECVRSME